LLAVAGLYRVAVCVPGHRNIPAINVAARRSHRNQLPRQPARLGPSLTTSVPLPIASHSNTTPGAPGYHTPRFGRGPKATATRSLDRTTARPLRHSIVRTIRPAFGSTGFFWSCSPSAPFSARKYDRSNHAEALSTIRVGRLGNVHVGPQRQRFVVRPPFKS
jgi:hypothetical protein